jgi:hypothetical protein
MNESERRFNDQFRETLTERNERLRRSRREPPYPTPQSDASLRNAERTRCRELVATFLLQHSLATGHGDTIEDLLVELDGQVRELQRLPGIIRAILAADERGQGTPFAEAMDVAAKAVGWKS